MMQKGQLATELKRQHRRVESAEDEAVFGQSWMLGFGVEVLRSWRGFQKGCEWCRFTHGEFKCVKFATHKDEQSSPLAPPCPAVPSMPSNLTCAYPASRHELLRTYTGNSQAAQLLGLGQRLWHHSFSFHWLVRNTGKCVEFGWWWMDFCLTTHGFIWAASHEVLTSHTQLNHGAGYPAECKPHKSSTSPED